jgi:hypothetical protein
MTASTDDDATVILDVMGPHPVDRAHRAEELLVDWRVTQRVADLLPDLGQVSPRHRVIP